MVYATAIERPQRMATEAQRARRNLGLAHSAPLRSAPRSPTPADPAVCPPGAGGKRPFTVPQQDALPADSYIPRPRDF
jgi:hypothetical protein